MFNQCVSIGLALARLVEDEFGNDSFSEDVEYDLRCYIALWACGFNACNLC